ncbi:MAG: hypothetical protein BRD41_00745 [Bacteroidetes bacterium QS_1_63_11]|nr:MAG: hypothetical protein BRD41_00745 [Bacteroidetes bacterium QS_1_63_11]
MFNVLTLQCVASRRARKGQTLLVLPTFSTEIRIIHPPMFSYILLGLLAGLLTGMLIAWYRRQD